MKNKILVLFIGFITISSVGQVNNNIVIDSTATKAASKNISFNYKQIIIPTVLIGYGVVGLNNNQIKKVNIDTQDEVLENIDKKIKIDDFLQYAPAVSVYALNNLGIEGKNNLKNLYVTGFDYRYQFKTNYTCKKT